MKNEEELLSWMKKFGAHRFMLGADVKDEKIMISGWQESTGLDVYDFIQKFIDKGILQIFCTDVSKDGLLLGPSIELYKKIIERFPSLHFIASGGVASMDDLEELKTIGCSGAIVGKAIYEGLLQLEDLVTMNNYGG